MKVAIKNWSNAIDSGALSSSNALPAIKESANEWGIANAMATVDAIYKELNFDQYQTDNSGKEAWAARIASGNLSLLDATNAIKESGIEWLAANNITHSFAVGTPSVPFDMMAQIHKGEMIVPTTFSDGLRNGTLNMGSNEEQIQLLKQQNGLLSGIITKLQEQLDTQNSSAESLEYIAKVS